MSYVEVGKKQETPNCWLMLGDSMEKISEIADGSIDAIICDPPFNIVEKIGSNLRIPQPFLKQLGLAIGDAITFRVTEKEIIITKSGPTLEELLSQCTAENRHSEVFSDSCGKELL